MHKTHTNVCVQLHTKQSQSEAQLDVAGERRSRTAIDQLINQYIFTVIPKSVAYFSPVTEVIIIEINDKITPIMISSDSSLMLGKCFVPGRQFCFP